MDNSKGAMGLPIRLKHKMTVQLIRYQIIRKFNNVDILKDLFIV